MRGQSAQGPAGTGTDHPADDGDLGRRTAEGLLEGAVEPGGGLAGAAGGSGAVGVAGVKDLTLGRFPREYGHEHAAAGAGGADGGPQRGEAA